MGKKKRSGAFEIVQIEVEQKVKIKKKNKIEQSELIQKYANIHQKLDFSDLSIIREMLVHINSIAKYDDEDLQRYSDLLLKLEASDRRRTSELNEILSLRLPLLKTIVFKQMMGIEKDKSCDEILYFDSRNFALEDCEFITEDKLDEIEQDPNYEGFEANACIAFYKNLMKQRNVIQYIDERANINRYQALNIFGDSLILDEEKSMELGGFTWNMESGLNTEYFLQQIESKCPDSVPNIYLDKAKIKLKTK